MIKIYGYSDQFRDYIFSEVEDAVDHAAMNAVRSSQKDVIFEVFQYKVKRMSPRIAVAMFQGNLKDWEIWCEDCAKISEIRTKDFDPALRGFYERQWSETYGDGDDR